MRRRKFPEAEKEYSSRLLPEAVPRKTRAPRTVEYEDGRVRAVKTLYHPSNVEVALGILSQGGSLNSVCLELGCHLTSIHNWIKKYPDFNEAVKIGLAVSQGWWEDVARLNLHNKDFNNILWMMNMSNRFGWQHRDSSKDNPNIQNNTLNITSSVQNSIGMVKNLSDEDLENLAKILERGNEEKTP